MPLLKRRRVLAAKIETTIGTAISLAAADGAFNAYDVQIQSGIEVVQRMGQETFAQLTAVPGARPGTVTFSTDLLGGTTAPAWMSTFLPACGWVDTAGTYSPQTRPPGGGGVKTLTMGVYEDGVFKTLVGAMGTFVIRLENGKPGMVDFTYSGVWLPPTDVAIISPNYPNPGSSTTIPPRFASVTMTVGAFTPTLKTVTIDAGNTVVVRPDATTASGLVAAIVTARSPKVTMDPESALIATKDHYGEWLSQTEAAMSIAIGSTTNKITIAAPKLQLVKLTEQDRDGVQCESAEYQCNRSADAGDDELTIAYS